MFTYSECFSIVLICMVVLSAIFYFLNLRLHTKSFKKHETYYIATRDYIQQNEDNIKTILDILAIPDIDDSDLYDD